MNNIGSQYIRDLLNIYTPSRNLRLIDKHVLAVPNSKMKTAADPAFSCIVLWNGLSEDIKSFKTHDTLDLNIIHIYFKRFNG